MAKAEKEYDKGKYDKAIGHYKKAWDHTHAAILGLSRIEEI